MASNLSERERILLGYASRDSVGSAPNINSPSRSSGDVDFTDVFGGPPRRSPINELRRGRRDSLDSGPSRARGSGCGSGSGLGERPVFGEVSSPARWRHLKDDFFSDIFPSSESACSSPRRMERDSLNSPTPGSRVLSPTRHLTPVWSEAVTGGSSLPGQLSQGQFHLASPPTQRALYKNEDGFQDTLTSSPTTSVASFTNRALTSQDDLKIDGLASYCQSPLSRQVSHSLDKSLEVMDSTSLSFKSYSQKDSASLESYVSQGQFHFSIYKWAGKGVTLIMPSEPKLQYEDRFKILPEIVVEDVDVILHSDNMPTQNSSCKNQCDNIDKSMKDMIEDAKVDEDSTNVKGFFPAEIESKFTHSNVTEKSDMGNSNNGKVPVIIHETQSHDIKNLQQLFDDDLDKQKNEEIIIQDKRTKAFLRDQESVHANINTKQDVARENKRNPVKVSSPSTSDAAVSPEKMRVSRVKGKVKDFIKIFNQEGSPKRKGTYDIQAGRSRGKDEGKGKAEDQVHAITVKADEQVKSPSRSHKSTLSNAAAPEGSAKHKGTYDIQAGRSRGKDEGKGKVDDQVHVITVKADEQVKSPSRSHKSTLSNAAAPINQSSEMADQVNFDISFDVHTIDDSSSERKDPLKACFDSTPDLFDASVIMEESQYEDLEGCLVEPISHDQNKDLKSNSDQDQIKEINAKIREWSKGKEGNIRSLLSTLQYVLWPESGWKPIPLVDIIEGSAVKRAYQKALLRLHPDKLQQKGASVHQKYIAEKVFDIMQEAWDHFNSISQIY